jgi:hypothetical protein
MQVSNATNAMKIACDYVSIANLLATLQVARELREHRLATQSGDDVLQYHTLLWYAYVWLAKQYGDLLTPQPLASTPSGNSSTSDIEMDVDPMDADTANVLSKAQRKTENARNRRKAAAVMPRAEKVGHDCLCPICPGKFSRTGLVNHLYVQHSSLQ